MMLLKKADEKSDDDVNQPGAVYLVRRAERIMTPNDASEPHAEEFDVVNRRCKCGKLPYPQSRACNEKRCAHGHKDGKI